MDKNYLLNQLQQNADENKRVQFNYSKDAYAKTSELKILNELENEGHIQKLSASLGYAIDQIL